MHTLAPDFWQEQKWHGAALSNTEREALAPAEVGLACAPLREFS